MNTYLFYFLFFFILPIANGLAGGTVWTWLVSIGVFCLCQYDQKKDMDRLNGAIKDLEAVIKRSRRFQPIPESESAAITK